MAEPAGTGTVRTSSSAPAAASSSGGTPSTRRFEHPDVSYDGYYRTGDGARRDADGHYWITGRVDDVVVVSGHNIGTAELQTALKEKLSIEKSTEDLETAFKELNEGKDSKSMGKQGSW